MNVSQLKLRSEKFDEDDNNNNNNNKSVFRGSGLSLGGYYYSEFSQAVSICPSGKGYVGGKVEGWEVKKVK
jgi:hypothetical protein